MSTATMVAQADGKITKLAGDRQEDDGSARELLVFRQIG